jgi:hypothetical protein
MSISTSKFQEKKEDGSQEKKEDGSEERKENAC